MASIRKRTWTSRGVEHSRWVVDYADGAGTRRLKTFATKKEADAWMISALHEVRTGTHTASSASITLAEAGDMWIKQNETDGLERSTVQQRRQHTELHINPFLGRVKLADLTAPRTYAFANELRAAGRSPVMCKKIITNLKTILNFAQRRGLVAQNVALAVRVGGKADARHEEQGPLRAGVDFPSRTELKALMEAATGRWRPQLIVSIFTGMRASELRGLPWRNVDLDRGIVHVRQRADLWGTIGKPKSTAGARDIPLGPLVINTLRAWKMQCPAGELDLVFPNGKGNVEGQSNIINRFWSPLQVKLGITNEAGEARYNFHMLRHAAASLFIQHLGWSPKRLQVVMGHSSIQMTFDLYGHLFENGEADRDAMKKIEAAIVAA